MHVLASSLPDVLIIEPVVFPDQRGLFYETYQAARYQQQGILPTFVQDNMSYSKRNVLRGLHYQLKKPQGKLVTVIRGAVLDVIVDIRQGSNQFGQVLTLELSEQNHRQVYIPPGFAHGFCVLSDEAYVLYKCTDYYDPTDEYGIRWDDPQLNIAWPTRTPILSKKDAVYPALAEVATGELPRM